MAEGMQIQICQPLDNPLVQTTCQSPQEMGGPSVSSEGAEEMNVDDGSSQHTSEIKSSFTFTPVMLGNSGNNNSLVFSAQAVVDKMLNGANFHKRLTYNLDQNHTQNKTEKIEVVDLTEEEEKPREVPKSSLNEYSKNVRLSVLTSVLPDADTNFLRKHVDTIVTDVDLERFVSDALDHKNYPKKGADVSIVYDGLLQTGSGGGMFFIPKATAEFDLTGYYNWDWPMTRQATNPGGHAPQFSGAFSGEVVPQTPPGISFLSHQQFNNKLHTLVGDKPHTVTSAAGPYLNMAHFKLPVDPFANPSTSDKTTLVFPDPSTDLNSNNNVYKTPIPRVNTFVDQTLLYQRNHLIGENRLTHQMQVKASKAMRMRDVLHVRRRRRQQIRTATHVGATEHRLGNINQVDEKKELTIEERRLRILCDVLFLVDEKTLNEAVKKFKTDDDLYTYISLSLINEKHWKRPAISLSSKCKLLKHLLPDASCKFLKQEAEKLKTEEEVHEFILKNGVEQKYPRSSYRNRKSFLFNNRGNKSESESEKEFSDPKYQLLLDMLPGADPDFLLQESKRLESDKDLEAFVLQAIEKNSYPKRDDFLRRREYCVQWEKYIEHFDVKEFLIIFPNPVKYFYVEKDNSKILLDVTTRFLQYRYRRKNVHTALTFSLNSLTKVCDRLDCDFPSIRPRLYEKWDKETEFPTSVLQEIAFIQNKREIVHFMLIKEKLILNDIEKARCLGTLKECNCCFEEKLPRHIKACVAGHEFCLDCIKRGSEVVIGNGGTTFPCYSDECQAQFPLEILKDILAKEVYSRVLFRKQYKEVTDAGIPGMETCSFCEFCCIPPAEDKVFFCLNPYCMKVTCRSCKKPEHLPLSCKEYAENQKRHKMQSYIEEKMTEALVRTCWKCGSKFVKETGCNMMTCKCGAKMCYVCRQPVNSYSHFQEGRCHQVDWKREDDEMAVQKAGKQAKADMEVANPGVELAYDLTKDLKRKKLQLA